jgi:hypothetical protein
MRILSCLLMFTAALVAGQPAPQAAATPAAPPNRFTPGKGVVKGTAPRVATPAGRGPTAAVAAKPVAKPAVATAAVGARPAPKPAAKPVALLTVPKDAHMVSPGLYRWTDAQGKSWMYRTTPFGVSRWADEEDDSKLRVIAEQTRATEQGDSVRFERPTPFGKQIWVRKKADMDDTERAIWAHQQEKSAPANATEKE